MPLPLWDPLRDVTRVALRGAGLRAAFTFLTALLSFVAACFLVTAGFVSLLQVIGLPLTALVFAILFAALALTAHLVGRALSARHAARILTAKNRASADIALAVVLSRKARPLLPIAAFIAAFSLTRRL